MTQNQQSIQIEILSADPNFVPAYASHGAAGADVRAYITEELVIAPGKSQLIPTGLKAAIPHGYEIQVRPRSGLALKNQVTVLNTPGTIDSDYRGDIGIILINHSTQNFIVTPGMRIAQLVVAPVVIGHFVLAQDLATTARGSGGFGHTGVH
jgi:dUTP pyrophosphatase